MVLERVVLVVVFFIGLAIVSKIAFMVSLHGNRRNYAYDGNSLDEQMMSPLGEKIINKVDQKNMVGPQPTAMSVYKERIKLLRNPKAEPIIIRVDDSYANAGWFWFLADDRAFQNCAINCKQEFKQAGKLYDVVLYHSHICQEKNEAAIMKPLDSDRRYLTIHAQLHNEQYNNFPDCAQEHIFEQTPIDISINYHRSSTINGNYFYSRPISFKYNKDEDVFQGMCAFVSNCVTERENIMKKLAEMVPLRSYGSCMHNADVEDRKWESREQAKLETIKKCKFYLAFENSKGEDYITEKFFQGFKVQTLPIYWGAPNVQDFMPTTSDQHPAFIDAGKYASIEELGKHLQYLLKNPEAYDRYFEWRKTGTEVDYSPEFMRAYENRVLNIGCKICVASMEMITARKILKEYGIIPKKDHYKIGRKYFEELMKDKTDNTLRDLYEIAYGRYWKKGNHASEWNTISYVTNNKWKEIPNNV